MSNPPNVKIRNVNWANLVKSKEGEDWKKPEPSYEFSDGRKFQDTGSNGGIYRTS